VRIIAGTGRGQARRILSNTATVLAVDVPWDTAPDGTSIFVVESPVWAYIGESSDIQNADPFSPVALTVPVDNAKRLLMGVLATTVDVDGSESPEEEAPFREIFVFGDAGSVSSMETAQVAYA
jgi:hypothetical protein